MSPTGQACHYVSTGPDNTGLPGPTSRLQPVHQERPRKPSGIDFDALAPTCQGCGKRSGSVEFASMLCRRCRTPETPSGADVARADRNQQIAEQYAAGTSLEKIAGQHHLAVATVKAALLSQGVRMRPRGRPKRLPAVTRSARRRSPALAVDEKAIIAEYLAGDTPPVIAARHGVLPKRIRRVLADNGVTLRDDRAGHSGGRAKALTDYDPELVADIISRYGIGQTIDRVATETGTSPKVVGVILHKAGVKVRLPASKPTVLDEDARAEMARQYAAGGAAMKIARAFHVSTDRCKAVIREQGVEIRRPGRPVGS